MQQVPRVHSAGHLIGRRGGRGRSGGVGHTGCPVCQCSNLGPGLGIHFFDSAVQTNLKLKASARKRGAELSRDAGDVRPNLLGLHYIHCA